MEIYILILIIIIITVIFFCSNTMNESFGKEMCIMDGRICTSDLKCDATKKDIQNALNFAYKNVCEDNGYSYIQFEDGYDCVIDSQDICMRDSSYPSTSEKNYLEWTLDKKCIHGIEQYRKFCEDKGMRYDKQKGTCHVTYDSCNSWGADFTDDDCKLPTGQKIGEGIVGTTVTRTLKKGFQC